MTWPWAVAPLRRCSMGEWLCIHPSIIIQSITTHHPITYHHAIIMQSPTNHSPIIIQSPTITTFTCKNTPTHTRQTQQRHNRRQQRSPTGISNCTRTRLRIRNDGSQTQFSESRIAATRARKRARFGDRPIAVLQRGGALQERQDDRGDSGRELRAGEAAD